MLDLSSPRKPALRHFKPVLFTLLLYLGVSISIHAQDSSGTAANAAAMQITIGQSIFALNGPWKFHIGDSPKADGSDAPLWSQPEFDDAAWQNFKLNPNVLSLTATKALQADELPGWQHYEHHGYTGYAWYRIQVRAPIDTTSPAILMPQYVDDVYEVYVNGQKIGGIGKLDSSPVVEYGRLKLFSIPAKLLREQPALTIALRFWNQQNETFPGTGHGGLRSIPLLGPYDQLNLLRQGVLEQQVEDQWSLWLVLALNGLVGIISLFLFLFSRSNREYLWAGIFLVSGAAVLFSESVSLMTGIPQHLSLTVRVLSDCVSFYALPLAAMYLLGVPKPLWRRANYLSLAVVLSHHLPGLAVYLDLLIPTAAVYRFFHFTKPVSTIVPALLMVCIAVDGLRTIGRKAWLPLIPGVLFAFGLLSSVADIHVTAEFPLAYFCYISVPISVLIVFLFRFTQQQRENVRLVDDMHQAQEVQQVLVPETPPPTPGFHVESVYLPAREVGGDFFQVVPGDDGSLLVVVGDVSGKGLKAAMTVSTIIGALRNENSRQPAQILARLNSVLYGQTGGFVTCSAALIRANGAMTMANAGNPAPYLNGAEMALDSALPLGMLAESTCAETYHQLANGDRLTFVSDGVVEATNENHELFGFERTQAISNRPAQSIALAAQKFGQEDDISVVCVTRAG